MAQEIELPDGTILEFPDGMSEADMLAQTRRYWASQSAQSNADAQTGQAMAMTPPRVEAQEAQGEVRSSRPSVGVAEDVLRALAAGTARGTAQLVGLPGTINDALDWPLERLGVMSDDPRFNSRLSGSSIEGALSAATGGATEYRGQTTPGEFAGTIGEFLPGAAGAGVRGLLMYGALPGATSELAGQVTEGTPLEPFARVAAPIATSLLTARSSGNVRPIFGTPERNALAQDAIAAGIRPTAGQVTGAPFLRRIEGTVEALPRQADEVTTAAMRSIGSNASRATPVALREARNRIGQAMDDALQGVSIRPDAGMAQAAENVAERYMEMAPAVAAVPRVRTIVNNIVEAATDPNAPTIDLSTLREWRTALGSMSTSADEATRTAAHALRRLIDDATDNALRAAGRDADLAQLAQARREWWNLLAVRDASTRAGAEAGDLSATQLNQSVIRAQGRDIYAEAAGTGLEDTTRAAAAMLRPLPTVEAGGIRRLPVSELTGASTAGGLGYLMAGWPGAAIGAGAGLLAPPAGQALMRSRQVQAALMDPGFQALTAARSVPGLLAGN